MSYIIILIAGGPIFDLNDEDYKIYSQTVVIANSSILSVIFVVLISRSFSYLGEQILDYSKKSYLHTTSSEAVFKPVSLVDDDEMSKSYDFNI